MTVQATDSPARMGAAFVRRAPAPDLPPPALSVGRIGWLRANLFSTPFNGELEKVKYSCLVHSSSRFKSAEILKWTCQFSFMTAAATSRSASALAPNRAAPE